MWRPAIGPTSPAVPVSAGSALPFDPKSVGSSSSKGLPTLGIIAHENRKRRRDRRSIKRIGRFREK